MKLFQTIGKQLGLELNASERIELSVLDKNTQKLSYEYLQALRAKTIDAYTFIQGKNNALILAQSVNGTHDNWLEALRFANMADEIIPLLLRHKLNAMLIPDFNPLSWGYFHTAALIGFSLQVSLFVLTKRDVIDINSSKFILFSFFLLFIASLGLSNVLLVVGDRVIPFVAHNHVNDVLNAAKIANIILNPLSIPYSPSIPVLNNAKSLEEMNVSDIPDKFLCAMTFQIMDTPLYCIQHPIRYDEKSINDWLKRSNTHPVTRQPLYREDLILDLSLKQDIDSFVKEKMYKNKYDERQSFREHSLFKQKPLIENDNVSVLGCSSNEFNF